MKVIKALLLHNNDGYSPIQIQGSSIETSMILYVHVVASLGTILISLLWFQQMIAFSNLWQLNVHFSFSWGIPVLDDCHIHWL